MPLVWPDAVTTVETAHCALRALRDGQVGLVSWGASARMSTGVSMSTKLFVQPERVVLSVRFRAMDISTMTSYGYGRLQDPTYFENCEQQSEPLPVKPLRDTRTSRSRRSALR